MMADVGDMPKVRGSRIAMPLAPPRPGKTPMITPSRMPTTISSRLNGLNLTGIFTYDLQDSRSRETDWRFLPSCVSFNRWW